MTAEELRAQYFGNGDKIGAGGGGIPAPGGGGSNPLVQALGDVAKSTVDDVTSLTALPAALLPSNGTLGFLDQSVEPEELAKRKRAVAFAGMMAATEGLGAAAPLVKGAPAVVRALLGAGYGGSALRMAAGNLIYEQLRKDPNAKIDLVGTLLGGAVFGAGMHGANQFLGSLLSNAVQKGEAAAAAAGERGVRRLAEDLLAKMSQAEDARPFGGAGGGEAAGMLAKAPPAVQRYISDLKLEGHMGLDREQPPFAPPAPGPEPSFQPMPGQEEAAQMHFGNQYVQQLQELAQAHGLAIDENNLRGAAEDALGAEGGGTPPFMGTPVAQMAHQILAERMVSLHSGDTSWIDDAARRAARAVAEPPKLYSDLLKGDFILPDRKAVTQQLHAEANQHPTFAGPKGKQARLAFASQVLGRPVSSFSDINGVEQVNVINEMRKLRGEAPIIPPRTSETMRGIRTRRGFTAARFPDADHAAIYDLPQRIRSEIVPQEELQRLGEAMGVPPDAVVEASQLYRDHVDVAARVNGAGRIQVPKFADFVERLPELAQRSRDEVLNSLTSRTNPAEAEAVGRAGRRSKATQAPVQKGTVQDARRAGRARMESAQARANVTAGNPQAGVAEPPKRGGARARRQYAAPANAAPQPKGPEGMRFMGKPLVQAEPLSAPARVRGKLPGMGGATMSGGRIGPLTEAEARAGASPQPSALEGKAKGGNRAARVKPWQIDKDTPMANRLTKAVEGGLGDAVQSLAGKRIKAGPKTAAALVEISNIRRGLEKTGDVGEARRLIQIFVDKHLNEMQTRLPVPADEAGKIKLAGQVQAAKKKLAGRIATVLTSDRVEREVLPEKGKGTPRQTPVATVKQDVQKLAWQPARAEYAGEAPKGATPERSVTAQVTVGPLTVRAHRGVNDIYHIESGSIEGAKVPTPVAGKPARDIAGAQPRVVQSDVLRAVHTLVADLRANHSARGVSVPPGLRPAFERLVTEGKLLEHGKGMFMMTSKAAEFPEAASQVAKAATPRQVRRVIASSETAWLQGKGRVLTTKQTEEVANALLRKAGIEATTGVERLDPFERRVKMAHDRANVTGDWRPFREAYRDWIDAKAGKVELNAKGEVVPAGTLAKEVGFEDFDAWRDEVTPPAPVHTPAPADPIVGTVQPEGPPVVVEQKGGKAGAPTFRNLPDQPIPQPAPPPQTLTTYQSFLGYLKREKEAPISEAEYNELVKEPSPDGKPLSAFGVLKRLYAKRDFGSGNVAPEAPVAAKPAPAPSPVVAVPQAPTSPGVSHLQVAESARREIKDLVASGKSLGALKKDPKFQALLSAALDAYQAAGSKAVPPDLAAIMRRLENV